METGSILRDHGLDSLQLLVFCLPLKVVDYLPALAGFILLGACPLNAEEGEPVLVEVVNAVPAGQSAEEILLTGTVVSQRRAGLSARAEGLVEEVFVDAGSEVEKGDVLLQLDTRLAEIELDLIRAEIKAAEVQADDAKRERDEVRTLTDSGAFSRTEAASREAMVQIREAELAALLAREEQQKERIERHRLVAPFSGFIVRKEAEAGEWVDTGAAVLALVQTDELWFDLQVAQEFLPAVQRASKATLHLDAYPGKQLEADVAIIVPVKDPVSRTFLTRLTFEDEEKMASPGMSGTATLEVRQDEEGSVTIPRDAVMRFPDGSAKVWTVRGEKDDFQAESVEIQTSGSLGETVQVIEGLEGGVKVVVRGNEDLSEGQAVKIRETRRPMGSEGL
ncbi:MAG: efflux RND transporter periplasmic adaptor subunit [Verrucomicrobiota bacterium]